MWRTGHSLIKIRMKELGTPLAVEMSAHLLFADGYYGYDDSIYAALRVLSILQSSPESLADFLDSLPPVVNTPELLVPCPENRKIAVVEEVRARLAARGAEVDGTDGVRVRECGGWWLLRAFSTQDILVLRCEAPDTEKLRTLLDRVRAALMDSGFDLIGF